MVVLKIYIYEVNQLHGHSYTQMVQYLKLTLVYILIHCLYDQ